MGNIDDHLNNNWLEFVVILNDLRSSKLTSNL